MKELPLEKALRELDQLILAEELGTLSPEAVIEKVKEIAERYGIEEAALYRRRRVIWREMPDTERFWESWLVMIIILIIFAAALAVSSMAWHDVIY